MQRTAATQACYLAVSSRPGRRFHPNNFVLCPTVGTIERRRHGASDMCRGHFVDVCLVGALAIKTPHSYPQAGLAGRLNCSSSWCDLSRTPLRKNAFGLSQSGKRSIRNEMPAGSGSAHLRRRRRHAVRSRIRHGPTSRAPGPVENAASPADRYCAKPAEATAPPERIYSSMKDCRASLKGKVGSCYKF